MVIKRIAQASVFAGIVVGLWASAASSQPPAQLMEEVKYRPIDSIQYDFGSKSTSGYFVAQAKKCVVMLMVYEKRDPDAASSGTATRVRLVLNPGETAGLDSEEGRSLNFTCGEEATALIVDSGEREKLIELQKIAVAQDRQRIAPRIDVPSLVPYVSVISRSSKRRASGEPGGRRPCVRFVMPSRQDSTQAPLLASPQHRQPNQARGAPPPSILKPCMPRRHRPCPRGSALRVGAR